MNTHTHTFNGHFSGTTWVSRYLNCQTNLDFDEARHSEWQWPQLGHMQVCTSLQTDNLAGTPPLCFFTVWMNFLPPNQQQQSTARTFQIWPILAVFYASVLHFFSAEDFVVADLLLHALALTITVIRAIDFIIMDWVNASALLWMLQGSNGADVSQWNSETDSRLSSGETERPWNDLESRAWWTSESHCEYTTVIQQYCSRLIQDREHGYNLPSTTTTLCQPFATTAFAKRTFWCCAPAVSSTLLKTVFSIDSVAVFKSRLKTFLFV